MFKQDHQFIEHSLILVFLYLELNIFVCQKKKIVMIYFLLTLNCKLIWFHFIYQRLEGKIKNKKNHSLQGSMTKSLYDRSTEIFLLMYCVLKSRHSQYVYFSSFNSLGIFVCLSISTKRVVNVVWRLKDLNTVYDNDIDHLKHLLLYK